MDTGVFPSQQEQGEVGQLFEEAARRSLREPRSGEEESPSIATGIIEVLKEALVIEIMEFGQDRVTFYHGRSGAWNLAASLLAAKGDIESGSIITPPCIEIPGQGGYAVERAGDLYERLRTQGNLKVLSGTNDLDPFVRSRVLSVNYALFGNTYVHRSAAFFRRGRGSWGEDTIGWALRAHLSGARKFPDLLRSLDAQTREAFQQIWPDFTAKGELLLISIPVEVIPMLVYDSRPYGVPTGRDIMEVLDDYEHPCFTFDTFEEFNGMQARILDLCFQEWAREAGIRLRAIPLHLQG